MYTDIKPKIVFLGATSFSLKILETLFSLNVQVVKIYTIKEKFKISYSIEPVTNFLYADLKPIAKKFDVDYHELDTLSGERIEDYADEIASIKPDLIMAMGWYYILPKKVRSLAKYGAWGIHASLLPKYAGGAPLVWAIINGETKSGVTLFRLSDGVDDGDIITQKGFSISYDETIAEVYEKAKNLSVEILKQVLATDLRNLVFTPQQKEKIEIWPQRSPADGQINWNWNSEQIHNFIRAQTNPYPGAWTIINGKKLIIWSATIIPAENEQ